MNIIQKRMAMRGQSGFTLVELLVAVAILAILAGVAVFAVGNLTDSADSAACDTEKSTLITANNAAKASADTNDTAATFIEGGASGLKYYVIGAGTPPAITLTQAGTDAGCDAVTLT